MKSVHVQDNNKVNFFGLNQAAMRDYFEGIQEKPYRASQVMKWIYHHGITDIDSMTNLARDLRHKLNQTIRFKLPEIEAEHHSSDGTVKWLVRIDEQNCIETVFIPEQDRGTLCISSQAGCALDCSFCATGKQGYSRNLDAAEIIGQLWLANSRLGYFNSRSERIVTNVVLMGMGEPLLNFENVITAVDLMTDDLGFNLARRKVTLSTSGIVPGIYKLAETNNISLAISLHAPDDELRNTLVPINRKYPITELMKACRYYSEVNRGDPITMEYVMLDGVNDSPAQARQLAKILKGIPVKINLIPFNPFTGCGYSRSAAETIDRFREILMNQGYITVTRKTRGDDINAACGQLTGDVVPRAKRLLQQKAELRT